MTTRRTKPTILIVGNGSMGQRRLQIIIDLTSKYNIETLDSNGQGSYTEFPDKLKPAAMFVCSPPYTHSSYLCEALSRDIPVFVEKPFCLPREISMVNEAVSKAKSPVMLGHNLLWHDGFKRFQAECREQTEPYIYLAEFGYRLDAWNRENQNSYSRYRAQGGGVLLDCLQDIDLAIEVLGGINPTYHYQRIIANSQTVDSESVCATTGVTPNDVVVQFRFDYLRPERRRSHYLGAMSGSIEWIENDLDAVHKSYIAETDAFLKWIETSKEPAFRPNPFRALDFVRRVYAL